MAEMLHQGATVQCLHGGQAQPTVPNPRVTVMGMPTVTIAAPYVVAGCAFPPPPAANGPCVTGMIPSGSTKVLVGGMPVLLAVPPVNGTCVPTGTPMMIAYAGQAKVIAQ